MHAAASLARNALRPILDFALPPRCPGCGGGDRGAAPFLPRLLVGADLPRRALLRALRAAVRLWRGRRGALRPLPGRAAGLSTGCAPRWPMAISRERRAQAQIWRPAGRRRDDRALHAAPSRRRRRAAAGAGAAAPLADLAARLQPGGADRGGAGAAGGARGAARPASTGSRRRRSCAAWARASAPRRCAAPSASTGGARRR